MAGFEPTTSSTPCWRDTGLRYIPKTGIANIKIVSESSEKTITTFGPALVYADPGQQNRNIFVNYCNLPIID
jgi:hypothetical protein